MAFGALFDIDFLCTCWYHRATRISTLRPVNTVLVIEIWAPQNLRVCLPRTLPRSASSCSASTHSACTLSYRFCCDGGLARVARCIPNEWVLFHRICSRSCPRPQDASANRAHLTGLVHSRS